MHTNPRLQPPLSGLKARAIGGALSPEKRTPRATRQASTAPGAARAAVWGEQLCHWQGGEWGLDSRPTGPAPQTLDPNTLQSYHVPTGASASSVPPSITRKWGPASACLIRDGVGLLRVVRFGAVYGGRARFSLLCCCAGGFSGPPGKYPKPARRGKRRKQL